MGGSLAPVRVAGFTWNGWQPSAVYAAKARARGYGTASHFIAICFLIAGKLKHLPANPFQTPLQRMVAS
jgi:hypothetical protein